MNSPPPLLVFDLDGTLVDTAGDLVGTLNYILTKERIPPLPLETARPMLGAGARALIECGALGCRAQRLAGAARGNVPRVSCPLRGAYCRREPRLSRRRSRARPVRGGGMGLRRLHQQVRASLGPAADRARPRRALPRDLRSEHVPVLQTRPPRPDCHDRPRRRRSAARDHGRRFEDRYRHGAGSAACR